MNLKEDGASFFQISSKSLYSKMIYNNMVIVSSQDSHKLFDVNTGKQVGEIFYFQLLIEQNFTFL